MNFAGRAFLGLCVVAATTASLIPQLSLAADATPALKNEPRPADIRLQETEKGVVFADKNGMTLYTDKDDPKLNTSACTYDIPQPKSVKNAEEVRPSPPFSHPITCRHKHKSIEVGAGAKPVGQWTILEDSDGVKQWAYRGHVAYTSVKDIAPGQSWLDLDAGLGQYRKRFTALYAPLDLPPDISVRPVGVAQVYTTFSGRTLYTLTQDRAGKSMCEGACLEKWHPFLGGIMSQGGGKWTLVPRADGTRQWAFNKQPLYTFAADKSEGDVRGNNLPGALVAVAYAAARTPSIVTVQTTPIGDLYADEKGKTLYSFYCPPDAGRECDDPGDKMHWWFVLCGNTPEECADRFRPVLAADTAKSPGNTWTIVTMPLPWSPVRAAEGSKEPGVKVWAYKGRPVFTYKYDDYPGMFDGRDIGEVGGAQFYSITAYGAKLNTNGTVTQAAR